MTRVLGFVAAAAILTWIAVGWVGDRFFGASPEPSVRASVSVLVGVVLWTLLVWWKADDLGRTEHRERREPDRG